MNRTALANGTILTDSVHHVSYRISRLLGRGATCLAYEAYRISGNDPEILVVLKQFYPTVRGVNFAGDRTSEEYRIKKDRFSRAARVFAELHNDSFTAGHVVSMLGSFTVDGDDFLVFDTQQSITLAAWMEEYPATSRENLLAALHVLANICENIGRLHDIGYLDLDLTPGNVLVEDRSSLTTALLDVDSFVSAEELAEGRCCFSYSAGFSAPECHLALAGDADAANSIGTAADVYSLGALLHYYLTGKAEDLTGFLSDFPDLTAYAKRELAEFLSSCMAENPDQRLAGNADMQEAGRRIESLIRHAELSPLTFLDRFGDRLRNFSGREAELSELTGLLMKEHTLHICAGPGTGKTSIAVKLADSFMETDDCPISQVLFLRAETENAFRADLGIDGMNTDTKTAAVSLIRERLSHETLLLVIDNIGNDALSQSRIDDFRYTVRDIVQAVMNTSGTSTPASTPASETTGTGKEGSNSTRASLYLITTSRDASLFEGDNYTLDAFTADDAAAFLAKDVSFACDENEIATLVSTTDRLPITLEAMKVLARFDAKSGVDHPYAGITERRAIGHHLRTSISLFEILDGILTRTEELRGGVIYRDALYIASYLASDRIPPFLLADAVSAMTGISAQICEETIKELNLSFHFFENDRILGWMDLSIHHSYQLAAKQRMNEQKADTRAYEDAIAGAFAKAFHLLSYYNTNEFLTYRHLTPHLEAFFAAVFTKPYVFSQDPADPVTFLEAADCYMRRKELHLSGPDEDEDPDLSEENDALGIERAFILPGEAGYHQYLCIDRYEMLANHVFWLQMMSDSASVFPYRFASDFHNMLFYANCLIAARSYQNASLYPLILAMPTGRRFDSYVVESYLMDDFVATLLITELYFREHLPDYMSSIRFDNLISRHREKKANKKVIETFFDPFGRFLKSSSGQNLTEEERMHLELRVNLLLADFHQPVQHPDRIADRFCKTWNGNVDRYILGFEHLTAVQVAVKTPDFDTSVEITDRLDSERNAAASPSHPLYQHPELTDFSYLNAYVIDRMVTPLYEQALAKKPQISEGKRLRFLITGDRDCYEEIPLEEEVDGDPDECLFLIKQLEEVQPYYRFVSDVEALFGNNLLLFFLGQVIYLSNDQRISSDERVEALRLCMDVMNEDEELIREYGEGRFANELANYRTAHYNLLANIAMNREDLSPAEKYRALGHAMEYVPFDFRPIEAYRMSSFLENGFSSSVSLGKMESELNDRIDRILARRLFVCLCSLSMMAEHPELRRETDCRRLLREGERIIFYSILYRIPDDERMCLAQTCELYRLFESCGYEFDQAEENHYQTLRESAIASASIADRVFSMMNPADLLVNRELTYADFVPLFSRSSDEPERALSKTVSKLLPEDIDPDLFSESARKRAGLLWMKVLSGMPDSIKMRDLEAFDARRREDLESLRE